MRVRQDPSSDYHAYVKFLVPETGNQVASAKLRLWVEDGSPDGGTVHAVPATWNESLLTWRNAPALTAPLGNLGSVTAGTWVEFDASAAVAGVGFPSYGIASASTNSVFYSSREGTHPPELVLVLAPPTLPVASFEGGRLRGPPPLCVQ